MFQSVPITKEKTISLRNAKANLDGLTRLARDGTRVIITSQGAPIADLVPHGTGRAPMLFLKHPGPLPVAIVLQNQGPSATDQLLLDRDP